MWHSEGSQIDQVELVTDHANKLSGTSTFKLPLPEDMQIERESQS